jgi:hypothetical protein
MVDYENQADATVADLPNVGPVTGSELLYADNGSADVNITTGQIKAYTKTGLAAGDIAGLAAVATSGAASDVLGFTAAAAAAADTEIAAKAVRFDAAQSLTAGQELQAQQNVGLSPSDTPTFNGLTSNKIISAVDNTAGAQLQVRTSSGSSSAGILIGQGLGGGDLAVKQTSTGLVTVRNNGAADQVQFFDKAGHNVMSLVGDAANPSVSVPFTLAAPNVIRVDVVQTLTTTQKSQGRSNLGLATVAASGAYSDLTGKPTLGTAAALNAGTTVGNLVQVQTGGKLPALDGSLLTNLPSGGSGGSLSDTDRRNIALERIYQAKLFGAVRRFLGAAADGFADSSGIVAGSSSGYSPDTSGKRVLPSITVSTSYANTGGTGNRTGIISVSATIGTDTGAIANLVDGSYAAASTNAWAAANGASVAGTYIRFDFGSAVVINEAKWYQNAAVGLGTWKWQGSNDASTWTDIGTSFTLGGATTQTQTSLNANVTSYRFYQLLGVSGTSANTAWNTEIEFKIGTASPNNMILVTTAQAADVSASNARALLEIDNTASVSLSSPDLTIEVTCDGGANWTTATIPSNAFAGSGQSGRKVVETDDMACTAGTSVQARVKTFNNKNIPIHGISCSWH